MDFWSELTLAKNENLPTCNFRSSTQEGKLPNGYRTFRNPETVLIQFLAKINTTEVLVGPKS